MEEDRAGRRRRRSEVDQLGFSKWAEIFVKKKNNNKKKNKKTSGHSA